jgi:TolB-like protein/class 3 adenylate cyclase/tetratricopeptide (TPR) repeat protein
MAVPIKGRTQGTQGSPAAEPEPPSRRLAAIMFTDLVGYSAMAHKDEALAIELLEQHRGWVRKIIPRHGGREIETVGDAFLIEFGSALAAVECAVALQHRFFLHNEVAPERRRMQLRVGIHLGDVEHAGEKVMGDGVNIASRIHGMAQPGGICVSEDVQRAVRNRGELVFTSMGKPKLKNIGTPLELFEVHAGRAAKSKAVVADVKRKFGRIPRWLLITVAVIVGINLLNRDDGPAIQIKRGDGTPAIAVLPFENLSAEPDSAFFTDGLHDTVIGHLSRVSGLKVISRTSVMGYRGKQKNLRRIGRELGADHILEGSVQRAGDRLRVVAQLIDTNTDTHVWSNEYNRDLKDVFAVQADIAQNVATAVHAKLTPQEQAGIQAVPTRDPAAYDLYLRAAQVERRTGVEPDEVHEAIGWLDQAIKLDPQFAQAHALLAHMHDNLYWHGTDPTDERRRKVGESADAALRLDPGLAEAHIAKALFHYHGSRNYEAALAELEIARRLAPGNASVHFWIAPIYRRQARWDDALASFEQATALDPLNTQYLSEYGGTLQMMRRYGEAGPVFQKMLALERDSPIIPVAIAYHHFFATGELAPLEKAVAALPAGYDPGCQVTGTRVGLALLQRRFDEAMAAGAACKEKFLPTSGGAQIPMEYHVAGLKWLASGRKPPPEAAAARDVLTGMIATRPDSAELHMHLGLVLAVLGDHVRAIEQAERALALMPMSRDALTGAEMRRKAVEIYANAGAEERAIAELEQLMKIPNGGHIHGMRLDPLLDPLRENPRFKKLLDEHLPKSA